MSDTNVIPEHSDYLGEALHLLKLSGTFYCQSELAAPWGVEMPPFDDCLMIHVVTAGHCWLIVEGEPPIHLQQGCLVLLPHGRGHILASDPAQSTTPLFDIPVEHISERYDIMRFGGDSSDQNGQCRATCCVAKFDHAAGQELIKHLPSVMVVNAWEEAEGGWLQSTLRYMAVEAKALKPGGETVMSHLADILIIQAIRAWIDKAPQANSGWLAALRDKHIGRALAAMHKSPEVDWTLASLASLVGMSRSGFSARFTEMVGESAVRYLTRWRMQIARLQLENTRDPMITIAESLGYQSEAAFSRAFKRVFGKAPGVVRNGSNEA
ncbi:AraC family transcriptional regulator [Gilvimarinus sp. SDUM040013]|uniref:AraC family transcriptional regulator n=1 Tax=Gilvimarinus gilvus TaxID=3058038 RepID=A0ABU4S0C6_9GAMM|nr:AraC family transcriptional regulator [Gilvimarinus sp. SDUM040013]MDO3387935.1 AraC family transcriptional regulator [Gilvimarinus sp. SDUM040013]MDX6848694.1 AraC family transcriptional regulator [Gilvimarinus sp. SDUM040013]